MDARIRTGASASDRPAGAAYCPPAGAGPGSATAGASAKAGPGGTTAGAGAGETAGGYSSSFGDVGASDYVGPADSGGSGSNGHSDHHPAEAFKEAGAKIGELKEFASYYVAAKLDAYKVAARNVGIYAALGVVGLIAGGTIISTAAVLLLVGIAWGLGKLLWDQLWLGALLVGLLVLGGLAAGVIVFMKKLTGTSHKQTVEKYQNRQRDQRINFGEDVRGRRAGSGH